MSARVAWLKPTKIKLIFLLEWSLFLLIEIAKGKLKSGHSLLVAAYPFLFFYLVACVLVGLSQRTDQIAQSWKLLALAAGLVLLDQSIKIIVTISIPNNASIPIVKNWFHLAHVHNYSGSWIAGTFNLPGAVVIRSVQWLAIISVLALSIVCHRYYSTHHRQSLWIDVAFLGVFTAYASWVWDMAFRGYVIDFVQLPGLVTADLKDILISISAAAVVAEVLENHQRADHLSNITNQEQKP